MAPSTPRCDDEHAVVLSRRPIAVVCAALLGCGGRTPLTVGSQPTGDAGLLSDSGQVFCTLPWTCDGGPVRVAVGQRYPYCNDEPGRCACYIGDDGGGTVTCYTCAAPDTPIATPDGYRPIASLMVGDLVYSENRQSLQAVPIRWVSRTPVEHHVVVRAILSNGNRAAVLACASPRPAGLSDATIVSWTRVEPRSDAGRGRVA